MMGILYVVGTPIGNLGDFSPRAVETLEKVDFIAAEDTRVTVKLLNHFGIKKPMVIYQKFNEYEQGDIIVSRLQNGESCAIVTDAGMPCISDPGETLVKLCIKADVKVEVVPGPSAVVSALAVSGLSVSRWTFEGFLSVKRTSRMEHLMELRHERRTMVFYEAPHKLLSTLKDMNSVFGERNIVVVKELTKIHETSWRGTLSEAVKYHTENPPKGEYVLVLEGEQVEKEEMRDPMEEAISIAKELMEKGKPASMAAKEAAKLTGQTKGEVYKRLMEEEEE
ncbi:MAG: 16S rRNA (cytidine(1402)-2'-O)-methyltransferase [Oscillospiraceae bacterium]|nr:16S rRNA (cytidine(1402)-2'-O)-methyltransferase [Oscillospiraceae bacterium]MBR3962884.1 16S rRNA (cytidine(1402)-2'-O)-methyltransferase [Oscillospiraceae bacterium]MBR6657449.1 16S rRNA (cytidine(1402)-2'-O)-methyltransferase [Oscillospiraceae bacterium]